MQPLVDSCDIPAILYVHPPLHETLVCELEETNISYTGLTKLAGILYASELHRRLSSDPSLSNITALSLHPGWVNTWCNKPWVVRYHLSNVVYVTGLPVSDVPEIGAYTSVFAAAAPAVKKERDKFGGAHIEPIGKVVKPSVGLWKAVTMRREAMAGEEMEEEWVERGKELWEVIERFLEERGI